MSESSATQCRRASTDVKAIESPQPRQRAVTECLLLKGWRGSRSLALGEADVAPQSRAAQPGDLALPAKSLTRPAQPPSSTCLSDRK